MDEVFGFSEVEMMEYNFTSRVRTVFVESDEDLIYKYAQWGVFIKDDCAILKSSIPVEYFIIFKRDANKLGYTVRVD